MTDKDVMRMYPEFVKRMTALDKFGDIAEEYHDVPWAIRQRISKLRRIGRAISGMVNEAGELNQHAHKAAYRGHDLNINKLTQEASDVIFFLQQYCNTVGITLDELISINVRKLSARYPDGYDYDLDKNHE